MHSLLADPTHRGQLLRVLRGLERRTALPGGAAREELDRELLGGLDRLRSDPSAAGAPQAGPPPRAVAVALALTLFAQPHLAATFARPPANNDDRPPLQPVLVPMEVLVDLLGLARWELEELQGEIDRRVGLHLKQHRAISWLWAHFGLPRAGVSSLVHVLFPGLQDVGKGRLGLSRRGGQLYALVEQARAPRPASLYLGWLDRDLEGTFAPRGTFAARYVDKSLRQTLCRCIGSDEDELVILLERMVSVVPRGQAPEFLALDRWRSTAYDAVTGLAGHYPRSARLLAPLGPDELSVDGWVRRDGDHLMVDNPKALFDSVALDRVTEVARQLQAHTLASIVSREDRRAPVLRVDELLRFDVRRHMLACLEPVIAWTRSPDTERWLADHFGVSSDAARQMMAALQRAWIAHRDRSWVGPLLDGQPDSVAVRLTAQLIRSRHALTELWMREPLYDLEHREAALLFAAFYFSEAPLDRLWGRDREALGEDPIGTWFWTSWERLLDNQEAESIRGTFQF